MIESAKTEEAERLAASIRTLLHALTIRSQDTAGDGRLAFSGTELAALGFLLERPGAMGREVAAYLGLTATTVQSVIDRLVRRGLVARGRHEVDGRAVALTLTADGARAIAAIRDQDVANCHAMLAALPPRRRGAFVKDLAAIAARIDGTP